MGVKEFSDMPDEDDIEAMLNEAIVIEAEGPDPYPASTYAAGVKAALSWVLEGGDAPLEVPE